MISSTLAVEENEADYEEYLLDSLYEEAAVLIVKEDFSRVSAIQKVQENHANRLEAEANNHVVYDEDGQIESYIDYDPVSNEDTKQFQVNAIKKELADNFDILIN